MMIIRVISMRLIFLLLAVFLIDGDAARVCGRTKCTDGAGGGGGGAGTGKFKYAVGTIYRYKHEVDVNLNLGNGTGNVDLHIESLATIKFSTPCEAELRISKASIRHATRGKYDAEFPDRSESEFKEHLERYNLRFTFEDGHVHELCPNPDDAIWAVNIKRGILSMLQNTMKRFDVDHRTAEMDINGICDTRYRLHEARKTSLILTKTKDLYSCTNRGKQLSIIQSNSYSSPPTHSQTALLDSAINCEIVIDHNIYERISCNETHRLQPLSNASASTVTFASLDLIEEIPMDTVSEIDENDDDENLNGSDDENRQKIDNIVPTNLLYDHSAAAFSRKTIHGELRTSRDLLKNMCILSSSGGQLEKAFSEIFSKFIYSARQLDYPSLSQLLARANGICGGGEAHILDALPFIGSSAAVKVMRDSLLKSEHRNEKRIESWMTSIALTPRPDVSTVAALLPLLDHAPAGHQLTLVYSSVIRAFCLNHAANSVHRRHGILHEENCLEVKGTGIERFLDRLELTIARGCAPRFHEPEETLRTLEALKAVGTMGLERDGLIDKLHVCIDNSGSFLSMETRIAAIDAHRRLMSSCQDTRDRVFLPRYRNVTLEPEIRIASYLQVMRCPDYNVIKTIKRALREEPINQVGSFVWSHLNNLLKSSSPTRIEVQSLLSDRGINDKFNSDIRKYSRNYESSFFSEEYNIGGTLQTNVIFSSKSYVPRMLVFNVTVDLFGESINILEVAVRLEGMEFYAEKFFGPNGPLAKSEISRHVNTFLRSIRSTEGSGDTLPNVIDNNFDDPRVSLSYKVFGNELEFVMLRGENEIARALATLDPWTKIKQILSGREIHYEHTGMLLDASYVVPSAIGLPVRLDLTGSAACTFRFSGLLNSDRLVKDTEMQLVGNIAPSVSIDVTGKMTVDAFYKSIAIKLRSNVYSSSAVKLRLDIEGMKLARLVLALPNRKLEVFTVQTDVFMVVSGINTGETELSQKPANYPPKYQIIADTVCSWPVIERLIGLKLCFDYQFPNVTDASYLVFTSGPTLFRTSVIKADPSAESYLFEYSWNAADNLHSIIRLAFDTPGSKINRKSSITVAFDAPTRNVSVLLQSAGNSLVAKGTYKRTDDEAMINVGLDINGTKHVDGYVGYVRKRGNYGYTFTPKLDLMINDENVMWLNGTVRIAHKNNVSQCDVDLNFQTKKIKSHVLGNIMRRPLSQTGNFKIDYQLRDMKKQTLQIEVSLANKSSKILTYKEANFKLQSSAYPHLNAIITTWYQQALGHLELHAEINTKPHLRDERYKLTVQLVLAYSKAYFQSDEAKMNAFIAISKPIQNLDIKLGMQRFSTGPSSKTFFLVRYAPGKEITLAVNLVIPRGSLMAIEGHANMTIPNFDSMLIDVRVTERSRGEYDLDLAGTWFSGHNATIRGTYADRSSIANAEQRQAMISHTLKLILRSPSLSHDILLNCKFYQDYTDTKVDINVEYFNADKYALKFLHSNLYPSLAMARFTSYAEVRCKSAVYAVTASVDIERELRLELHLDDWRDVHFIATGINEEMTKEFGFVIKWDANRDPALKLSTQFQFNKYYEDTTRNYSAVATLAYPGRLLQAACLFGVLLDGHRYTLDSRLEWDPTKTIRFTIDADYNTLYSKNYLIFDSQMLTPFDQWRKTLVSARYHWTEQELSVDCHAHWQDNQKFLIVFSATVHEPSIRDGDEVMIDWQANCALSSTVHAVGWLTANFTHQVTRHLSNVTADTKILVKYSPDSVIDVKSRWRVSPGENTTLTGNLQFVSPYLNYKNGDIKCQLRFAAWNFDGLSNIEIDKRRYTGVLIGDLTRIKESMIQFNVTTPIEKYAFLRGRFGLSERNKHAVAEIVVPSGPIGVEVLCQFFTGSTYDFDVMLHVATPIDLLQKFLLVAKLAAAEADFRMGYNNITTGFTAIWYYENITDFHHSYVLYTPIHGLHESGVVAKLIATDLHGTIDTEFSIKLVETKLGLAAKSGPKFSPLKMLDEQTYVPEKDDFNWRGDIEINAAIIEPIVGSLDVDKFGPLYQIIGAVEIPQGKITLDDRFVLNDMFDMKNSLEIKTPLSGASEITSLYVFHVDMENSVYLLDLEMKIYEKNISAKGEAWLTTGLRGNYTYAEGVEDDSKTHMLHLIFKTPQAFLGHVDIAGTLDLEENIYRSKIALRTNVSSADVAGTLELDGESNFFDGLLTFQIDAPVLVIPSTKLHVKKDFERHEKQLGFRLDVVDETQVVLQAAWLAESENMTKITINMILKGIIDLDMSHNENGVVTAKMRGESVDYRFDGIHSEGENKVTGKLVNMQSDSIYNIDIIYNISREHPGTTKIHAVTIIDGNEDGTARINYINLLNWNADFQTDKYNFQARSHVQTNGYTHVRLSAETPLTQLTNFVVDGNFALEPDAGGNFEVREYRLNDNHGHLNVSWKLKYMENMFLKVDGLSKNASSEKNADVIFYLINPKRAFRTVNLGFDIDIDEGQWRCASNTTVGLRDRENIDVVIIAHLPPPNNDTHQVLVTWHANGGIQNTKFAVGYSTARGLINYAADGSIVMAAKNLDAHLGLIWGKRQTVINLLNMTFEEKSIGLKYSLRTPLFIDEETAVLRFTYNGLAVESLIDADLYYPAHRHVGTTHISYRDVSNINGTVNVTTPSILRVPYAACNFIVLTTLKNNKRFIEVFWPNNSALFHSQYSYHSERLDSNLDGLVQIEIPLNTRHVAELNYGCKKRPQITNGHADLMYNKDKILVARYTSKGESRAGFDKDSIQITLENSYQPIGITYINQFEYSGGNAGTNYPTVEWKRLNVYRLDNSSVFNMAGESRVRTFHEGQEIELKAKHFNRTVSLRTDYQVLPGEFDHNTWISLADDAWASYNLNIINKTTESVENQFLTVNLAYPWRNFSLNGSYRITPGDFDCEAELVWNKTVSDGYSSEEQQRTIGAEFFWTNMTDKQMAVLSFKHPSLTKEAATITGHLLHHDAQNVLVNASIVVDYSNDPDKLLQLTTILRNETFEQNSLRYSYEINGTHPETQLDLAIYGHVQKNASYFFYTDHRAYYRRSYLPAESGQLFTRINTRDCYLEYHRESSDLVRHLNVAHFNVTDGGYHVINGTMVDTLKSLNATGAFYLNFDEKLTWLVVNYTPDAVESLQMYGNIPDARNAIFDVWRTYERDLVISDIAFYLKLNHSRLVASTLKWRPELKADVTGLIKDTLTEIYNGIGNDLDYWRHYVRNEVVGVLSDVWEDAREDLQYMLEDWNNFKELDADLERLKIYLNDSYNANDFYLKDVTAVAMYVIDELALQSHIESLPNIFNEIWEMLGESGKAIRNSLLWIIEATKNAYKKLSEVVSAILKGESIAQIASVLEKIVEKYDKFIKDLHVAFIKYMESLWAKFSTAVSQQWSRSLKMIEPLFIRVLHYFEAVLWKASREVVDFLYSSRNELIKSPYFDRFTNFTHDVDRLYRDIKANDVITNIRKYTGIIVAFLRERYFTMVPFGSELKDLVDEIISELAELKKLASVNYALQKINYIYERLNYVYKYLQVQEKIENVAKVVYAKLTEISQTALQAESKYREAKTKFIFDPNVGLLCLEQKLPMSWHAFNQTPEFQEIPEYRALSDARNYFTTSNATFWSLYYHYRPYTDPYNWLPPFKAQAMIVGLQHLVTFDARHLDFIGHGRYLLAHDFVHNEFALFIEYSSLSSHKIIVSIDGGTKNLEIDVFNDTVKFAENTTTAFCLPAKLEDNGFVYQVDNLVIIELKKKQFKLKCNLKYDVCVVELSGWYYGKTAGLLGTMNNEPWDDTTASNGVVTSDVATFATSWSIPRINSSVNYARLQATKANENISEVVNFCNNLFSNSSSEFSGCFMTVEPQSYAEACPSTKSNLDVCTLAIAYMQACGFYETYLRIPDKCTSCSLVNGTTVPEGEFRELESSDVPNSTDIVFIVEAKVCNTDIRQNRSIDEIVTMMSKELNDRGIKNNRWSLVVFGGNVYEVPSSIVIDGEIFTTDPTRFIDFFDNFQIDSDNLGSEDVFAAIGFASQLVFRAGVSKTFILMPCSHCEPEKQTLDYSVLHQVLIERDITMHIIMNGDFIIKKQRLLKMLYGIDATKSYTKKDVKVLIGDSDLRRQVKLPKSTLGYCTPLALETNGTIFSAKNHQLASIKKFANVFGKRVASTASPSMCQNCECTADNDGISHMECMPCIYPMPVAVEHDFLLKEINNDDDFDTDYYTQLDNIDDD